jgi:hypothetical protein
MRIRAVLLLSTPPLLATGCSGGGKADGPPGGRAKGEAQPAVPVVVSTVARKTVSVQA